MEKRLTAEEIKAKIMANEEEMRRLVSSMSAGDHSKVNVPTNFLRATLPFNTYAQNVPHAQQTAVMLGAASNSSAIQHSLLVTPNTTMAPPPKGSARSRVLEQTWENPPCPPASTATSPRGQPHHGTTAPAINAPTLPGPKRPAKDGQGRYQAQEYGRRTGSSGEVISRSARPHQGSMMPAAATQPQPAIMRSITTPLGGQFVQGYGLVAGMGGEITSPTAQPPQTVMSLAAAAPQGFVGMRSTAALWPALEVPEYGYSLSSGEQLISPTEQYYQGGTKPGAATSWTPGDWRSYPSPQSQPSPVYGYDHSLVGPFQSQPASQPHRRTIPAEAAFTIQMDGSSTAPLNASPQWRNRGYSMHSYGSAKSPQVPSYQMDMMLFEAAPSPSMVGRSTAQNPFSQTVQEYLAEAHFRGHVQSPPEQAHQNMLKPAEAVPLHAATKKSSRPDCPTCAAKKRRTCCCEMTRQREALCRRAQQQREASTATAAASSTVKDVRSDIDPVHRAARSRPLVLQSMGAQVQSQRVQPHQEAIIPAEPAPSASIAEAWDNDAQWDVEAFGRFLASLADEQVQPPLPRARPAMTTPAEMGVNPLSVGGLDSHGDSSSERYPRPFESDDSDAQSAQGEGVFTAPAPSEAMPSLPASKNLNCNVEHRLAKRLKLETNTLDVQVQCLCEAGHSAAQPPVPNLPVPSTTTEQVQRVPALMSSEETYMRALGYVPAAASMRSAATN